jgi:hypothetical protein
MKHTLYSKNSSFAKSICAPSPQVSYRCLYVKVSSVEYRLTLNMQQRNALPFMEYEGSLPYSQEPATGFCSEPDKSSSQLPTVFLQGPF